jgi:hypothetical protein
MVVIQITEVIMISVISQYRLIEAVQVGLSSAQNSANPMLSRLDMNGGRRSPSNEGASSEDPPKVSFDKFLEIAVSHYR